MMQFQTGVGIPKGLPSETQGVVVRAPAQSPLITLLDAETSTDMGDVADLGFVSPIHNISIVWSGATPTDTTVEIHGSLDDTSYVKIADITTTSSPDITHTLDKGVRYIKAKFASKTGGDGTSAVTVKMISSVM